MTCFWQLSIRELRANCNLSYAVLYISNLSNVVVHKILEKAIDKPEIAEVYTKEVKNSLDIAKRYRERINPLDKILPAHDTLEVKEKIMRKVRAELNLRIERGYSDINLSLVEEFTDNLLRELGVF